jgi:hypothetical protein
MMKLDSLELSLWVTKLILPLDYPPKFQWKFHLAIYVTQQKSENHHVIKHTYLRCLHLFSFEVPSIKFMNFLGKKNYRDQR